MFRHKLDQLAAHSLTRRLTGLSSATGPTVQFSGRRVILLSSNDYLGLATHPEVVQASVEATQRYGAGAGASRLVSGTLPPHQELESTIAAFKQTDAALAFSSGYLANLGVIGCLIGRGGLILADRLCHASLIDGCRLSGATFRVYRHADSAHVEALLRRRQPGRPTLIVTDGLFSMDGDLAPLPELAALARRYDATLYVDDAHGTGVMGETGRGTIEHFAMESAIPFHMGTLGKALGSSGAYVAGPQDLIDYLINTSRPFIFTTAPPPGAMAAAAAALGVMQHEPDRRARLWANQRRFSEGLRRLGFRLTASVSPILPLLVGTAAQAIAFAEQLLAHGVMAPAIRPPTVPDGTSRIRVTVTSEHTADQLDEALVAFERAGRTAGVL
ncbi:8-amino-7-oxononanoate synthase [Nitrospira moscoviensis]|uniref:8-amino-7-ketopelargonate synthase n=1 Tax=Nitrospira moscoviensis TaxID=42253 RepID=A0A0K2GGV6_NITMO|nr:8-amino-7-oxononanoate synthase [Nitrospira moscoviensis]ALA60171.1 8-amino-7-oxononanoate synthase [Nitrospira moscoviensis]